MRSSRWQAWRGEMPCLQVRAAGSSPRQEPAGGSFSGARVAETSDREELGPHRWAVRLTAVSPRALRWTDAEASSLFWLFAAAGDGARAASSAELEGFFFVRTARGAWMNVLLIIDLHTRELLELCVSNRWASDSAWAVRAHQHACAGSAASRSPCCTISWRPVLRPVRASAPHHGDLTEAHSRRPALRQRCRRAGRSVRFELLNHVRPRDADEPQ